MTEAPKIDPTLAGMFPFAFPGAVEEKESVEPPPLHPELEQLGFNELYQHVFDSMLPGEKCLDFLKRVKANNGNLDDAAKYISELYARGEVDIFERDWVFLGISAGRIGDILEMKWNVKNEEGITGPFTSLELAPKARVLAAMDSLVSVAGKEENWLPIDKLNFAMLKL
ncbi:hypothetical protein TVAG_300760 [Trichomonas vaginalis G3]|uniref:Uncharacterized protein n=1 Tax=Trichomonas vaginalis (strain ATCC PRA-98 / G3) TaxID=412133 RepID=A2FKK7_TRIV3|nr:hypothetical protein TVAGG3_0270930 [Trichomonas vaginalis G3]EAX94543.1 hypothetical protein TVAG_300760 [Trichomonas vaginalis G3]KAI5525857.1 hypothetical protein TVAGG3_0270930 [Trichomonas vaginalis G3]|eukprot:XP_001307473.1 hypothetical protein [Trichomonas vaginalis G3]